MEEKGREVLMDVTTLVVFGCVVFLSAVVFGDFTMADTMTLILSALQVVGLSVFGNFAMRLMCDALEGMPEKIRRRHLFLVAVGLMVLIIATGAR